MTSPQNHHCHHCKTDLPLEANFCLNCGKPQRQQKIEDSGLAHIDTEEAILARQEPGVVRPKKTPTFDKLDPITPPARLMPQGTQLGPYIIHEVVGEGGMGVVYKATDTTLRRTVAIKTLHTNFIGEARTRQRFSREARIMTGRAHPNVVKVFDTIEHKDLLAIVMEFVDGPTLQAYLEQWGGRLPFAQILMIFDGVLSAMASAHDAGIVHRDLKPDNIMLQTDEHKLHPKVADFGIAKAIEGTQFTVTGAVVGTFSYMSPEQVESPGKVDHRTDIYALGVSLYQACTGRCPFETSNNFSLMMAHVRQSPPAPSLYRTDIPPPLEALILEALEKKPEDRPQSCAQFRTRLISAMSLVAPKVHFSGKSPPAKPIIKGEDGSEFLLIPAGIFQMGPSRREVFLDTFYAARYPTTNRQFLRFINATGYKPDDDEAHRFLSHWQHGHIPRRLLDHPVVFASWQDACAYCSWAGKRLPSEAEWEKSARGLDGRKYPWGRVAPNNTLANFGRNHRSTTAVNTYKGGASPFGVEDMSGNVWEWCEDVDNPKFYLKGPSRNPRNTVLHSDPSFVVRGGSWLYEASSLRTYSRSSYKAHFRFNGLGFRCVLTP